MSVRSFDEFGGIRAEFKKHLAGTFCEKAAAYMRHYRWNTTVFERRTGLSADTFSKINNGRLRPEKRTAMSLCVGLPLDYRMALDLLDSAGCSLTLNDPHDAAYDYVLTDMRGESIEACNRFLRERGAPLLGLQERNTDRIGKVKIA